MAGSIRCMTWLARPIENASRPLSAPHSLPNCSLVELLERLPAGLRFSRAISSSERSRSLAYPRLWRKSPYMISVSVWLPGPDAAVGGDVEDDGVGRDLLADAGEQDGQLVVAGALREALRGGDARPGSRFWIERPSILAKLDLPEPKKPETQTPTPSWGLFGVSAYASRTDT